MASVSGSENQLVDLDVAEENAALLEEIIDLLERSDREHAEVIMLIGKSGAGKSAMISTIHKVLTGKYYQIARQGSGKAQSVTLDLGRYENCGISLETIKDEDRRQMIEKILPKLPHIVDCAGLGDADSPELREILELLIGGFIPPNTHIEALQSKQKEFGVGCLKRIYPKANPAWTVTKVVFMQSCRVAVPKNLIECLTGVLKITDPSTLKRKYTAEVFLLITKYDLVRDPTVHLSTTSDKESMTLEEFVKVEDAIAPEFNIVGALESNRIRWASFTDRIQGDNQYIDNIALKFLKRMVEPGPPPPESAEPVVGVMKKIDLYMFKLKNELKRFFLQDLHLNVTPALFLVAIVFMVVIAVLYKLLSAGV
ncbi:uncharacterized protein LOC123561127 isoform X2 [Mercenaria mercenaria]|uniref:uncharacterized protein LOC123561127 isoform X2 n=1 Tax=Mercenaria mercenaria TaxID=6596 RepID=UPI00234F63F9|nr:uncharacterized protein LOC123561127 isoform X2 [Mercenaria mercenaria]